MADDTYEIVSRPKTAEADYEIVSRPKVADKKDVRPPYTGSILPYSRDAEGNHHPAVPLMIQDMIDSVMRGGEMARGQRPMEPGEMAGLATLGLGSAAGAASSPAVRQGVATAAEKAMPLINKGATAAGGLARGVVNTVDDVIKSAVEGVQRRGAAKTAEEAAKPTKESIRVAGGGEYKAANTLGGDVLPEVFQTRISGLRPALEAQGMDVAEAENTYKNTRALLSYLDRKAETPQKAFKNLVSLQQEVRNFVQDAKAVKDAGGNGADYAAAQTVSKNLDEFINGLTKEDMVGGADPKVAQEALDKGKELWGRQAKMNVVEDVIKKAKRMDSPDYLQQEFKKIALDDFEYGRFTPAEQKVIDDIAKESKLEKVADAAHTGVRKIGKVLSVGGTATSGRIKKAEDLMDMIATGPAAQTEAAATEAAKPSFGDRINDVLRPPLSDAQKRYRRE